MLKELQEKYISIALLLLILVPLKIYASTIPELEDAYVEIKSKNIGDDFFFAKYDIENDEIYVGLKTLFYFLELYSVQVDTKTYEVKGEIDGKKVDIQLPKENCIVIDDDIYVPINILKEKLNFSDVTWSSQDLKLNLTPNFKLPYEEREKSKVERLRLEEIKLKDKFLVVEPNKKILAPGLLKLRYSKQDLSTSVSNINLEYGTQFLYGDLYINQEIKPKNKNESYRLTYKDIYGGGDLVIGDFYLQSPSFIKVKTSLEGISIGEKDTYSVTENDETIIRGEAQGADVIELYQNNILIDYIQPTSRNFEFKIRERNAGGEYRLKIYYQNGQIENREVYTVGSESLLNKDEVKYDVQVGRVREESDISDVEKKDNVQKLAEIKYGLTENITVGIGTLDLISDENEKYKVLKNILVYKTNFSYFPTLITLKNFYEYEVQENSFEFLINQKIKKYDLRLEFDNYGEYLGRGNGVKTKIKGEISRNFIANRIALGYLEEKEFQQQEERGYYLSFENRSLRSLSFFIDAEFLENENKEKKINLSPGISYSGLRDFNTILQADIEKTKTSTEIEYSLKFLGRRKKIEKLSTEYNFGAEVTYNDEEKFKFTLDFNIYFDNYLYVELPTNKDTENNFTTGIIAEKVIDLSNIKRVVKDREVDNSWIYGRVFIDKNSNGKYDQGETLLPDVSILVDGKSFKTNEKGIYASDGLLPDEKYTVKIDVKTIDPMLKETGKKVSVKTRASIGTEYDIPVQAISMVTGYIYPGEGISSDQFIRILSMTTAELDKDGELYKEIDPEFDGLYFFDDVLPGKYILKFNYLGNEPVEFSNQDLSVDVELENEDEGEYFEGFDTVMNISEDKIKEHSTSDKPTADESEEEFNMDDILNNY